MDSNPIFLTAEQAPANAEPLGLSYNKGRIFWQATVSAFFAMCGVVGSLPKGVSPGRHALMALAALFFGAAFIKWVSRLFVRGPFFVISPNGFSLHGISGIIAWTEVIAISRTKTKRTDTLKFDLNSAAAATLKRTRLSRLIHLVTGRPDNVLIVPLRDLHCKPDMIVAKCASYFEAVKSSIPHAMPRASVALSAIPIPPPSQEFSRQKPWFTYALLALLVCVYAAELKFAVNANKNGAPSPLTLAYLGGTLGDRIWANGEWWRLFTAPLMHSSTTHIFFNGVALWFTGKALERLIGWRWFGAVFAFSALAGAMASVYFNSPNIVGVGASGGIMGLLAALFVISFRLPEGKARTGSQVLAVQMLIPALLPLLLGEKDVKIDYAAHLGGAVAGVLIGLFILKFWTGERPEPRFGLPASLFAGFFCLIALGSLIPIIHLRSLIVR